MTSSNPDPALTIGALAARSGVKVPTIRYYEGVGLLPVPTRTSSERRTYGAGDVRRLRFVRHARDLGFDLLAVRALLALADEPSRPCAEADALARAHLAEVEAKIARLEGLRAELRRMVDGCAQGRVGECRVIEVLGDHDQCLSAEHGADPPAAPRLLARSR